MLFGLSKVYNLMYPPLPAFTKHLARSAVGILEYFWRIHHTRKIERWIVTLFIDQGLDYTIETSQRLNCLRSNFRIQTVSVGQLDDI